MTLCEYFNSQFSIMQNLDFLVRILAACFCGACIGFERTKRFKEAGIRTHIIVCCAAALIMIVSKYGFADLTYADGSVFNGTRGAGRYLRRTFRASVPAVYTEGGLHRRRVVDIAVILLMHSRTTFP